MCASATCCIEPITYLNDLILIVYAWPKVLDDRYVGIIIYFGFSSMKERAIFPKSESLCLNFSLVNFSRNLPFAIVTFLYIFNENTDIFIASWNDEQHLNSAFTLQVSWAIPLMKYSAVIVCFQVHAKILSYIILTIM